MRWFGLTGGIATGKSTVSKMLQDFGLAVVDADQLARRVVRKGTPTLDQIVENFGAKVLDENEELDRQALGEIVFKDEQKRRLLESITHPEIQNLRAQERLRLEKEGAKVAFYDVPLLFEKKLQDEFDAIFLVYCSRDQQLERLIKRNDIDKNQAEALIDMQIPIDEKKLQADFIVDNSGDKKLLKENLQQLLTELRVPLTFSSP